METANAEAEHELALMRRLVRDLNFRLEEATEMLQKERLRASKMEAACFAAAEDWKAELEAMEKQHDTKLYRLQRVNDHLRLELTAANHSKDEALRLARDTMVAGEIAAKRANSLSFELGKAIAAVEMVRQAGVAMVSKKEAELKQQVAACFQAKQQAELLRWELFELRQRETKLCELENEFQILKEQLAGAKEREHHLVKVLLDANAKLEETRCEMHRAKAMESEANALLSLARAEVEEIQERWKMAHAEAFSLTENVESLRSKLITSQEELLRLQERESFACAQGANAEAMLLEARECMAQAMAREESKDHSVKKLTSLLDEAMSESEILRQQVFEVAFEAEFGAAESISRAINRTEKKDCMVEELVFILNEARLEAEVLRQQIYIDSFEAQVEAQGLQNNLEAFRANASQHAKDIVAIRGLLESRDKKVTELMALLANAKMEGQILRQQTFEAVFEAHFGAQSAMLQTEVDIEQEVVLLRTVLLEAAEHVMGKAQDGHEALDAPPPSLAEVLVADNVNGCGLLQEQHSGLRQALAGCLAIANKVASDLYVAREQHVLLRDEAEERENLHTEQVKHQHTQSGEEMQFKSPDLSEPWEMVEGGLEAALVTIKQEEYDVLKRKLHEVEELKCLLLEMEPLSRKQQRMPSAQLDNLNMENKEVVSILEQDTWEHYVQMANPSVVAVEVGRSKGIKGERLWKTWEKGHEATHSGEIQSLQPFRLPLRETRLRHHSLSNTLYSELSLSQKEEEGTEFLSISSAKKKKKPLFLRIGTYLTKQKK